MPAYETTCLLLEMLMKSLMMYIQHELELCKIIVHGVGKVFRTSLEKMLLFSDKRQNTPSPKKNARILGLKIKMNRGWLLLKITLRFRQRENQDKEGY